MSPVVGEESLMAKNTRINPVDYSLSMVYNERVKKGKLRGRKQTH